LQKLLLLSVTDEHWSRTISPPGYRTIWPLIFGNLGAGGIHNRLGHHL